MRFEAVIGLECHAQLNTRTKMFCGCAVVADAAPNVAICPVCMGHPGTLPVVNAEALALGLRAALALGCDIHRTSIFSRKHYFYPDLPKGYQITQYDRPFATGGAVHVAGKAFGLTRIHFEEDAGKMLHGGPDSLVDWNRAGVPLIEIVSNPDLRSAGEAEGYLRALHRVLVVGGICLGDLEKGHFRCDANVSIHREGEPWGPRVEIKNINSFRFVARAIRYEIERQRGRIEAGSAVEMETRMWTGSRTVALRKKEEAADYRYFAEPDLGALVYSEQQVADARGLLPGIPLDLHLAAQDGTRVDHWTERYGISAYDVGVLLGDAEARDFFVAAVAAGGAPKAVANAVMSEVLRRDGVGRLLPGALVAVLASGAAGELSRESTKQAIATLWRDGGDVAAVIAAHAVRGDLSAESLATEIAGVVLRHPDAVARYRAGNQGLFGFFMGKLMEATARRIDPKAASIALRAALDRATG